MVETGLKPVLNPSTILINDRNDKLSGTAIASTFEGQKTFLVEVQSLVTPAVYGTPQRSCNGFNLKRLNMLLAVLEKKCGFKLSSQDVFLNIAGGIYYTSGKITFTLFYNFGTVSKFINSEI